MVYKHIMVAIDGSKTSKKALDEAVRFARDQQAELRVVHVLDESVVTPVDDQFDYHGLWQSNREKGMKFLQKIGDKIKKNSIKFDCLLVELKPFSGRLGEKIVHEAKSWPADLLVLGTHGRHGFSHLFLGSVAENVMRHAPMPVLLIRGH